VVVVVATEEIRHDEERSIHEPKAWVRTTPHPFTSAAITGASGTTATAAAVGSLTEMR